MLTKSDLLSKIQLPNAEGCMLWTGLLEKGYGRIRAGGRTFSAREAVLRHFNGIQPISWIRSTCKSKDCVAPNHMILIP